jgi:hypothetical protein
MMTVSTNIASTRDAPAGEIAPDHWWSALLFHREAGWTLPFTTTEDPRQVLAPSCCGSMSGSE